MIYFWKYKYSPQLWPKERHKNPEMNMLSTKAISVSKIFGSQLLLTKLMLKDQPNKISKFISFEILKKKYLKKITKTLGAIIH